MSTARTRAIVLCFGLALVGACGQPSLPPGEAYAMIAGKAAGDWVLAPSQVPLDDVPRCIERLSLGFGERRVGQGPWLPGSAVPGWVRFCDDSTPMNISEPFAMDFGDPADASRTYVGSQPSDSVTSACCMWTATPESGSGTARTLYFSWEFDERREDGQAAQGTSVILPEWFREGERLLVSFTPPQETTVHGEKVSVGAPALLFIRPR